MRKWPIIFLSAVVVSWGLIGSAIAQSPVVSFKPTCVDEHFPVTDVRVLVDTGMVEADIRNDSTYYVVAGYMLEYAIHERDKPNPSFVRLPGYIAATYINPDETGTHLIALQDLDFEGAFDKIIMVEAHLIEVYLEQGLAIDRKTSSSPPSIATSVGGCKING